MSKKKYVYYFTYGSDKAESGHPYEGGWSVVEAPSMGAAAEIFRAIHPDKHPGRLNCCSVYSSDVWGETIMAQKGSSFGRGCHEKITWEVFDNDDH